MAGEGTIHSQRCSYSNLEEKVHKERKDAAKFTCEKSGAY